MAAIDDVGGQDVFINTHRTSRIWIFRGIRDGSTPKGAAGPDGSIPEGAVWGSNFLALKCDGEGNLNGVRKDLMKFKIHQASPDMPALALGRKTSALSLFVNSMKMFDVVLIPDGDQIYLGDVQSEYVYSPGGWSDRPSAETSQLNHIRTMKIFGPFDRKKLPPELRKALRVQYPVACLDKFRDEIMTLLGHQFGLSQAQLRALNIGNTMVSGPKMIDITYPLRSDLKIYFKVPQDITSDEAKRLSIFFRSIYFRK